MERIESRFDDVVADEIRHLLASIERLSLLNQEWQIALAPSIEAMYEELDRLTERSATTR